MATATNDNPILPGVELTGESVIEVSDGIAEDGSVDIPNVVFIDGKPVAQFDNVGAANGLAKALRSRSRHVRMVAGVRALADFMEANPEVNLSWVTAYVEVPWSSDDEVRAHCAKTATMMDAQITRGTGGDVKVEREFGDPSDLRSPTGEHGADVSLVASYNREKVCTPEIVDGQVVWNLPGELGVLGDES